MSKVAVDGRAIEAGYLTYVLVSPALAAQSIGLPEGGRIVGADWDERLQAIRLLVEDHGRLSEVPAGGMVPVRRVTFRQTFATYAEPEESRR